MKKRIRFMLVFFAALIFMPLVPHAQTGIPSVSASSAVLIDASSGRILFGKNENQRRGMASTTKIMTAIVALENSSLDKLVTVAPSAAGVEGSSVYLYAGEEVTMETLLYALMLQSANDAAAAIAYEIAGGIESFADMMNEKAASLGLHDTHFMNPHGLDDENHYTTAYELALISAYALKNDTFAKIVSTEKKVIPLHNSSASRLLVNHNRLLRSYDDIIGVKTGFTKKCGRTLVSAAERDGVRLICVTLNDGDDWKDHRALLDYGFSLYETEELAAPGEFSCEVPVCGGSLDVVRVSNTDGCHVVLPRNHGAVTVMTELPRFLYAGVKRGDRIGTVRFFADGAEIASVPLYAEEDVPAAEQEKTFWQKIFPSFG